MGRKLRLRDGRLSKRMTSDERGQDIVEFALVVPFIALLFLGIIEFGIIVFRYNTVSNAAREGARYGIVHPNPGTIQTYTTAYATSLGLNPATVTAGVSGGYVEVTIQYTHTYLVGPVIQALGGDSDITLQSVSRMRTEQ